MSAYEVEYVRLRFGNLEHCLVFTLLLFTLLGLKVNTVQADMLGVMVRVNFRVGVRVMKSHAQLSLFIASVQARGAIWRAVDRSNFTHECQSTGTA